MSKKLHTSFIAWTRFLMLLKIVGLIVGILLYAGSVNATTYYARTAGTWTPGTATSSIFSITSCGTAVSNCNPGAGDDISICNGIALTVAGNGVITNLTLSTTTSKLIINSGQTLTVSGTFSNSGTTSNGVNGPGTILFTGTTNLGTLTPTGTRPNVTIGNGTSTNTVSITAPTLVANLTVSANATLTNTTFTVGINGSAFTNSGTFNSGTGAYTFSGASQSINGNATTFSNITVSSTGTGLTNNITAAGGLTIATTWGGTGTFVQATSANLNIGAATVGSTTLTATASSNTVVYNGTTQTVKGTTYYNLTSSAGTLATLGAAATVSNNLSVTTGILADGGLQITGNGSGTLTVANGATLQIGAGTNTTETFPTLFTTSNINLGATSTVNYNWITGTTRIVAGSVTSVGPSTYGNLTITGASGTKTAASAITVAGNLTIATAGETFADGGFTITVNGNVTNNATHSGAGKILLSGGSASHTVTGTADTYGTLELNDANGATLANTTVTTNVGTLTVTAGTLTLNSFATSLVVANTNVSGTLTFNNNTGTRSMGTVTVNPGGTWNNTTVNEPVTINGATFTNTGTFNSGTGAYTFSGVSQSINGNATTFSNITVSSTGTGLTNNITAAGGLTIATTWGGTGTFVQATNANLNIGAATVGSATLTATASGNTVTYNGTTQTVKGTTYYNLTSSAGTLATLGAAATISNNLSVTTGTLADGGFQITGNGTGTLNVATGATLQIGAGTATITTFPTLFKTANILLGATSTVIYNSTGSMTVAGNVTSVGPSTYGHLILSGASTKTASSAITIAGNLTINTGTLADGGFLISGPGTGTGTFTISNTGTFTMTNATTTTSSYQAGSFPIFGTYAFDPASTVNYNGAAAQPLYAIASPGYGNLSITTALAASTKTASGPFAIQGTLIVANANSVFYYGSNTVTVNGNIVNLGVINGASGSPGSGKILITGGSGAHTLTTTGTSITATYGNLEFNDATDPTTISNASGTAGTTNVTGFLTVTSGTVNIASFTTAFAVTGATSVTGTLSINNATGTTFTGDVTVNTNGTFNASAVAVDITFGGNVTNNGTSFDLSSSTGTTYLTGTNKTLGGSSPLSFGLLTISGATLTVPSGGSLSSNGDITINGILAVTGGTVTTANGHGIVNNGTMTISSGTVTLGTGGNGGEDLKGTGSVSMTGGTLQVGHDFKPGVLTTQANMTGGTVEFLGNSGPGAFGATSTYYFYNVQIDAASTGGPGFSSKANTIIIQGNLTIQTGGIADLPATENNTANSLTLGATPQASGYYGSTNTSSLLVPSGNNISAFGTGNKTNAINISTTCSISLTSAAGTNTQSVCLNSPINNITYSTTLATGANFSGLPTGVTGNWASNVATISGSPSITTGSPFNYTVTLTGNSCSSTATGTITVLSQFTSGIIATTGETICYGGTPASTIGSSTAATGGDGTITYSWRSSADSYTAAISGATSATYLPPAGLTATRSYQRYAHDGTCNTGATVSTGTWTVTVVSALSYGAAGNTSGGGSTQTICYTTSPASLSANGATGSGSFSYQWYYKSGLVSAPSGTSTSGWTLATGTGNATATFSVPSAVAANTTYACFVTPGGSPNCGTATWATGAIQVTVEPNISYGTSSDASGNTQTICSGTTPAGNMVVSGATGSASFSYQWYYQAGTQSNPGGGTSTTGWIACGSSQGSGYNTATFTPSGTLTATTSFACFVTPGGSPSCGTATWANGVIVITVNPIPSVTNSPLTQTICSGVSTTLVTLTSGVSGATFAWTATATTGVSGFTANGTGTIPVQTISTTGTTQGTVTYVVTPTAAGCSGTATNYTVLVNPAPTVTNSPLTQTICSGSSTTLVTLTSGVSGATFTWTATATAGVSGFTASGTSTIPVQTIGTTASTQGTVTYAITPTATSCSGAVTNYTVLVNPIPTVTNTPLTQTICSGSSTTLVTLTSGVSGTTFAWTATATAGVSGFTSSGTGTIPVQAISTTASTQGTVTYAITPSAAGCAGSVANYTVIVNPIPTVTNTPLTQTICSGSSTTLVTLTSGVSGTTFAWTATATTGVSGFTSSSTSTIPVQAISTTGTTQGTVTYVVTPTAAGCSGTVSNYTVLVNPATAIGSQSTAAQSICLNQPFLPITVTATGTGTLTYQWWSNTTASTTGGTSLGSANGAQTNSYTPQSTVTGTLYYYCIVHGSCGVDVTSAVSGAFIVINDLTWLGGTSSDWNIVANWSCPYLPNATTNVLIGSATHQPVLSFGETGICKNIVINSGSSLSVNTGGTLQIAETITNGGTLTASAGTIELIGTSAQTIGSVNFAGNTVQNLTVSNPAGVTLSAPLNVAGVVKAATGNLTSGGNLTLLSTGAQTALIDGSSGTHAVIGTVTMERYISSAFGYKYVSTPFTSNSVSDFSPPVDLGATFPSFYKYDENNSRDSSGVAAYQSGWVKYLSGTVSPMAGYAANLGAGSGATTLSLNGTVNNGPMAVTLYNHNRKYTQGFNLVGNPYPSPIDWDVIVAASSGIGSSVAFFNTSGTDQYTGSYSYYSGGVGGATNNIAAMQGFFVLPDSPSGVLNFTNSCRTNNLSPTFKEAKVDDRVILQFAANYDGKNALDDVVYIYFDNNSSLLFDKKRDALKMLNTDVLVPNLYSITSETKQVAIKAMPVPVDSITRIPLGLTILSEGWINLNAKDISLLPSSYYIYLVDAEKGVTQDLRKLPDYRFNLKAGTYNNRFNLIFSLSQLNTLPTVAQKMFLITCSGSLLKVTMNLPLNTNGTLYVTNMSGQIILHRVVSGQETVEITPASSSGLYILTVVAGNKKDSQKLLIRKDYE